MNHSIYSADRSTHLKVVVVALVAGIARHAGQEDRELAGVEVGQSAIGVDGDDVFDVGSVALRGNRGGEALARGAAGVIVRAAEDAGPAGASDPAAAAPAGRVLSRSRFGPSRSIGAVRLAP